ncbi:synaptic vesicle 2-related protein-like [Manduca sexta]|uniref:synaptic vesicle 2-related protein-like n=1 Tax=Manduca sexta TaxID=7130 RepID=UPI00188EC34D|nr:synaptic vesicle 2-related protein-like [Manduca sexta]
MINQTYIMQGKTTVSVDTDKNRGNTARPYSYDEAIELAGNGWYNRGLLATLSISLLGMGIDMFGFSVIVTGCACDFHLEHSQKSILMSMPFIGAIGMAYVWGYLSDTKGRRMCLLYGMWGGFISSILTAFSPNWIVLAVLKVFSTSLCSSAQSCTVTLLGESCTAKVRDFYLLIMSSVLMLYLLSYVVPGYFILSLPFSINLGFIYFTPWRLLAIILSLPLGISALGLHFFYESPKFLVNIGKEGQALNHLQGIWARNGGIHEYPVQKVYLNEEQKVNRKGVSILQSLVDQTIPLFKPPLLLNSLQMFYLITIIYSINNSLVMWMPLIVDAFGSGVHAEGKQDSTSLCSIISSTEGGNSTILHSCTSSIELSTLLSGVAHGIIFSGVTVCVSKLASKKKYLLITFLLITMLSTLGAVFNENNVVSLVLFVGMLMTNLCMGILFTYYVDMFPTSYRGMAACLGVMVARLSGVAGVNFLGSMIVTHCAITFYAFGVYLLSGIIVSCFLP